MPKAARVKKDPDAIAKEVRAFLRQEADPEQAASGQRFFKEPVPLHGVPAAVLRRHAKDLIRLLKPGWTWSQAAKLAEILIQDPQLENKAMGLLVLAEFRVDFPVRLLPRLKSWLAWHCGNWATVDLLAPEVLGPLLEKYPDLITEVEAWSESPSLWVRRGAAVCFVKMARSGKHLGAAYRVASRLLADEEDLMHKAVGWLLREAGKTDRGRLERYLRKNGSRMPRTTVRYAIEHFPEQKRKRLLSITRRNSSD